MNFTNLSFVFLGVALFAIWGWKKNMSDFKQGLKEFAPELWEKLQNPGEAYTQASPDQRLREYIWKREYLEIEDNDLIQAAKTARLYHLTFSISLTFLLLCYAMPFLTAYI